MSRPTGVNPVPLNQSPRCEDPSCKQTHGKCADLRRGGYPVERAEPGLEDCLPPRIRSTWREVNILSSLVVPLNRARGCGTIMTGTNRPALTKQRSGGDGAKLSTKKTGRIIAFNFECVS